MNRANTLFGEVMTVAECGGRMVSRSITLLVSAVSTTIFIPTQHPAMRDNAKACNPWK